MNETSTPTGIRDSTTPMRVSVITPTYNSAVTLPRAAKSVFGQSYEPIEYIVVDDGSTDDTESVVRDFTHELTYLKLDHNRGVGSARNIGLERASGDAIMFLDADDKLPASAVSPLVKELQSMPRATAGVYGQQLKHNPSRSSTVSTWRPGFVRYETLCDSNSMGPFGGKLIRADVFDDVGTVDESFPSSEDFDFFMRTVKTGYTFKCIDDVTYEKHNHHDQISGNTLDWVAGHRLVLEKHGNELTPAHRARRWYWMGRTHAKLQQMDRATDCFRNSLQGSATNPKYAILYFSTRFGWYDFVMRINSHVSRF